MSATSIVKKIAEDEDDFNDLSDEVQLKIADNTKSYQLLTLNKNEWVGNELCKYREDPVPFQVVAVNNVEAIKIKADTIMSNQFHDIRMRLEEIATKRMTFIKKRVLEITKGLSTDAATGNKHEKKKNTGP